jgi:flagellar biogenesis protein FliO
MRDSMRSTKTSSASLRNHGLMGSMFQMWMARRSAAAGHVKQMQLLETLPLGGKRQLMLVQCGTEQFLVGGGLESVETIVKVAGTTDTLRQQDDLCG